MRVRGEGEGGEIGGEGRRERGKRGKRGKKYHPIKWRHVMFYHDPFSLYELLKHRTDDNKFPFLQF